MFHVFLATAAISALACLTVGAQSTDHPVSEAPRPATVGVVDFLKPIHPDPILQHSKELYVLYGCAYCHGVELKVQNGEAADLLHSKLVAIDTDGKVIAQLLRSGIPQTAKLSPMPQFSDLSEREMLDIAQWVHYSRREEHFKELMGAPASPLGDAAGGAKYFTANCSSCHTATEIKTTVNSYKDTDFKARLLRPTFLDIPESFRSGDVDVTRRRLGRDAHGHLMENYAPQEVADLTAYLKALQ